MPVAACKCRCVRLPEKAQHSHSEHPTHVKVRIQNVQPPILSNADAAGHLSNSRGVAFAFAFYSAVIVAVVRNRIQKLVLYLRPSEPILLDKNNNKKTRKIIGHKQKKGTRKLAGVAEKGNGRKQEGGLIEMDIPI